MKAPDKPRLPTLPDRFEYRLGLASAVTPRELKNTPRHRWFYFPHSYSPRLINEVLEYWGLGEDGRLLDPCVGAGTTTLAALDKGLSAAGWDLSPLAVLVSRVKAGVYEPKAVHRALEKVMSGITHDKVPMRSTSARLRRAFSSGELKRLLALRASIRERSPRLRDFLLVGLLATAARFSRAVPDGGWFRWVEREDSRNEVVDVFAAQIQEMTDDLTSGVSPMNGGDIQIRLGDARSMTLRRQADAVITSPPYPNRHDYTRIFHIELLLTGQSEARISEIRKRSIRSHVEARAPLRGVATKHKAPESLTDILARLPKDADRRIRLMLEGYFADLYAVLSASHRSVRNGGRVAFVVGNVRHAGVIIPVDQVVIDVAQQAGFIHDVTWVVRLRGNSAQQMGRYGREPSRESVVMLNKRETA